MSCDYNLDCTQTCRLVDHGNILTKCLTKREISQEKLIAFLQLSCANFSKNLDEQGRSALHVACSTSKPIVAEFLLKNGANVHQKDSESLWTCLHRSLNYGCLDAAMVLKQYGASFDSVDMDYSTPLQLLPKHDPGFKTENCVYVWGKNKNFNLGIGNISNRDHPEFVKGLPPTSKASINKYHSLFVTSCNKLFGAGHSKEGRFGVGSDVTLTYPKEIEVKLNHRNEKILDASAGLSHSLILTNKSIYGTGSNKYLQLGMRNTEMTILFKEIALEKCEIDLKGMLTVIACDYYSVFVSRNGVFVCGLNVGQFGGIQESIAAVRLLHPLPLNAEVVWAVANNACICAYLQDKKSSFLNIYYSRKVKTYKNPLNEKLKQCIISGGEMLYNSDEIVKNSSQKPLTITIMTEHNNIFIWYEDILKFVKVHMSTLFTTQISSITMCGDQTLIVANHHLFKAEFQHKVSKMYQLESKYQEYTSKKDTAEFLCSKMKIKRLPFLSNVKQVCCDPNGESFVAILSHVAVDIKEPKREKYDFSPLLDTISLSSSGIMDIKFAVKEEIFSASRFIVSSRCKRLKDLAEHTSNDNLCLINEKSLTPEMFRCILIWIYKNHLSEEDLKEAFPFDAKVKETRLKEFLEILMAWDLKGAYNCVISHEIFKKHHYEVLKQTRFKWFSMEDFPELSDLTILLDENQQLKVHKAILIIRFDYFKMMFYHSWSESSTIDLRQIKIRYMRPIIQFAYDNEIEGLMNADYSDSFMYNIITILDQFLMENIKAIFEVMIMKKVNLRNCAENLEFSFAFNCNLLKDFCLKFISLNLTRLLEENVLDLLDAPILTELTKFYKKYFDIDSHMITPAFDAPSDEQIENVIADFDYSKATDVSQQALKRTPKSKSKMSKSEILKRNYEKNVIRISQSEEVQPEPVSPNTSFETTEESKVETWQKKPEKKEIAKRKGMMAVKCNEIMKSEEIKNVDMVDLTNLLNLKEDSEQSYRSKITLADFGVGIINKRKETSDVKLSAPEVVEIKPAWNMASVELKLQNSDEPLHAFKSTRVKSKKASPKQPPVEGNFSSIVRNERKEKANHEKILSKPLLLTQIEEKAIMELQEFYNVENIFDENIKIQRKAQKLSVNLSQWQHS